MRAILPPGYPLALSDVRGSVTLGTAGAPRARRALRAAAGAAAAGDIAYHLDQGMSFVQQTGARVFEPQIVQERASLAQLRGDSAAASEELQRAHALYVEIGAMEHSERLTKGVARGGPVRASCVSMQPVP